MKRVVLIEEATGFTLLEIQKKVGRFMLSQILENLRNLPRLKSIEIYGNSGLI